MSQFFDQTLSQYIVPGYQSGYYELLCLSTNSYSDGIFNFNINDFDPYFYMSVSDFQTIYANAAETETRYAGEGPTPTTFELKPYEIRLKFSMPIRINSNGYPNMGFDLLYNYGIYGYYGSKTKIKGRYKSATPATPISSGATSIVIDNIVEFLDINTPFSVTIYSDDNSETSETVSVSSVNKSTKTLTLASSTLYTHTPSKSFVAINTTLISAFPNTFSILSLREGLFTDCLVDKISFNIKPDSSIVAEFEIVALNLHGQFQINARDNFSNILTQLKKYRPYHKVSGASFRILPYSNSTGLYGMGDVRTYSFMYGFRGLDLTNFFINDVSFEINNNLEPTYTLKTRSSIIDENLSDNLLPFAYSSKGRKVESTINYTSSINPYLLFDKIAGPNSVNGGGLIYDFNKFSATFHEIAYSPGDTSSTMDDNVKKSLKWTMMTGNLNYVPSIIPA
jgi:hypothetical protein